MGLPGRPDSGTNRLERDKKERRGEGAMTELVLCPPEDTATRMGHQSPAAILSIFGARSHPFAKTHGWVTTEHTDDTLDMFFPLDH